MNATQIEVSKMMLRKLVEGNFKKSALPLFPKQDNETIPEIHLNKRFFIFLSWWLFSMGAF